jgi:hypothetical protein
MSVSFGCWVLSGRRLCVGLITRSEESYRMWFVEVSVIVKPGQWGGSAPRGGCVMEKKYMDVCLQICRNCFAQQRTTLRHCKLRFSSPLGNYISWTIWTMIDVTRNEIKHLRHCNLCMYHLFFLRNSCTLPTVCTYVYHMILRTNSNYFVR